MSIFFLAFFLLFLLFFLHFSFYIRARSVLGEGLSVTLLFGFCLFFPFVFFFFSLSLFLFCSLLFCSPAEEMRRGLGEGEVGAYKSAADVPHEVKRR